MSISFILYLVNYKYKYWTPVHIIGVFDNYYLKNLSFMNLIIDVLKVGIIVCSLLVISFYVFSEEDILNE